MSQEILSKLNTTHIEEISSSRNEPEWLKDYRKNSLSVYDSLPIETSPLYNKYTDAKKMDPEKVSLSTTTTETVPAFLQKRLGELDNEICIIQIGTNIPVSYTHLRAHETKANIVCRLLLEKKKL